MAGKQSSDDRFFPKKDHPVSTHTYHIATRILNHRSVRFKIAVSTPSVGQPPQSSSLLLSHYRSLSTGGTQECAWVKRKTQGQPITKVTARKKNPAQGGSH